MIRGVKNVGEGIWTNKGKIARTGAKVAGGVMGTVLGAGVALTTGDASSIPKFMVGGALSGSAVGNTAANLTGGVTKVAKKIAKQPSNIRHVYEEETYGLNYAKKQEDKRQNAIRMKNFMRDDEEKRKYHDIAAKISKNGKNFSTAQVMEAAWDMKKYGVNDDKLIERALKLEAKDGKIGKDNRRHEGIINVAQAMNINDSLFDRRNRRMMEDRVRDQVGTEEREIEAMKMYANLLQDGGEETYMRLRNSPREIAQRQKRRGMDDTPPQEESRFKRRNK